MTSIAEVRMILQPRIAEAKTELGLALINYETNKSYENNVAVQRAKKTFAEQLRQNVIEGGRA